MKVNKNMFTTLGDTSNGFVNTEVPWIEKYRPKTINDVISHELIIESLKKFIAKGSLPHMLFFGPPGTGKTSTILCCTKEIYGDFVECMVLRLNASNERGIDTVRTKIKNFVSNKNSVFFPRESLSYNIFKLVILDEIDSMTVEAQGMLRQTIEKNSETTRFCLICNNIDKINPALQSRCAPFHFIPVDIKNMTKRLYLICKSEKISIEDDVLNAIIQLSNGDMRIAINILQASKTIKKNITVEDIYKISGFCTPDILKSIFNMLTKLFSGNDTIDKTTNSILELIVDHNITIFHLLDSLKNFIMTEEKIFTDAQKIDIINQLARIEIYDSVSIDQQTSIMVLTSIFILCKKK